jgi:hypothetical protein
MNRRNLKNRTAEAEPFKREALQQLAIETIALKNILENEHAQL